MTLENVTKILDSKVLTNKQKQLIMCVYRLHYMEGINKINNVALSKYMGSRTDKVCELVRCMQKAGYLYRVTPRGNIEINWSNI